MISSYDSTTKIFNLFDRKWFENFGIPPVLCLCGWTSQHPTIESSQQYNNILFTVPLTCRWVCNTVIVTLWSHHYYTDDVWCGRVGWIMDESTNWLLSIWLPFGVSCTTVFVRLYCPSSASSLTRFLLFIYASTRLNACNVLQVSMSNIPFIYFDTQRTLFGD